MYMRLMKHWDNSRYIIAYGGSSSSKSISILQKLTLYALANKKKRITISAESLPVLKKTVLPDWKQHVMTDLYNPKALNKQDMVYTFPSGSIFQFVPADDAARWHGLRQDIVYFDELFYIKKDIYDNADIRTEFKVISSFNPVSKFWITDNFDDPNTYVDHSTYKDNPYLKQSIIDALEKRIKTDENFYNVYVLGKFGSLEGLIFDEGKNWNKTTDWPKEYKKRVIAGDFGYSVDPTAILDIRFSGGIIYVKELAYKTELLNSDIAGIIKPLETRTVFDSAEPKSIAEIRKHGVDIYPSQKGRDSINNGIDLIKQFNVKIHNSSLNLIKELRNYSWAIDRQGQQLGKPIERYNHAIDALRYGIFDLFNRKEIKFI